jgi:hypothetical protein
MRPDPSASSIERLQAAIFELVAERQALRERGASSDELEWNRLRLVARYRQVSAALVDRHLEHAERDAA